MPDAKRVDRGGKHLLKRRGQAAGITLLEMLVSIAILLILMTIIFQIVQMTSQAWKKSSQGTGTMQQARVAFERLTRNLSQATLNTYYDYIDANGNWPRSTSYTPPPANYGRQSDLQFISGNSPVSGTSFISSTVGNATQITQAVFFQAPLGIINPSDTSNYYGNLTNLVNACGYFVIYGQDTFRPTLFSSPPSGLTVPANEYRYRLMEYLQPSENLSIYTSTGSPASTAAGAVPAWISYGIPNLTVAQTSPITVRSLASNIVALIIMPEQFSNGTSTTGAQQNTAFVNTPTTASTYNYDSAYQTTTLTSGKQSPTANQLPPLVKVIMVAIDEPSAIKLAAANPAATTTSPPNLVPSTLFQNPASLFTVGGVEGDLDKFQDILNASSSGGNSPTVNTIKLNYYIFQTDVIIRGSKWTSQ